MAVTDLEQGPSNAKRYGLCLPGQSATMCFYKDIIATLVPQRQQRSFNILQPQRISLKVFLSVAVVDDDFSGAFLQNNPSNGGFPAAGADDILSGEPTRKPRFHQFLQVHCLHVGFSNGGGGGDDEGGEFGGGEFQGEGL